MNFGWVFNKIINLCSEVKAVVDSEQTALVKREAFCCTSRRVGDDWYKPTANSFKTGYGFYLNFCRVAVQIAEVDQLNKVGARVKVYYGRIFQVLITI